MAHGKKKGLTAALSREKLAKSQAERIRNVEQKQKELKDNQKVRRKQKLKQEGRIKALIPFSQEEKVILVGEGDFSFACSLIRNDLGINITATSYDSEKQMLEKYPDSGQQNLQYLRQFLAIEQIVFSVDATKLNLSKRLARHEYDICLFNFPHTGSGVKDQVRNVRQHQQLMLGFFEAGKSVIKLDTGRIVVSLFDGLPYSLWNIKKLAKISGLRLQRSGAFDWDVFPGYNHRLTSGMGDTTKTALSRDARFYIFEMDVEKDEKVSKSDSE